MGSIPIGTIQITNLDSCYGKNAWAYDPDKMNLYLSASGHNTILRDNPDVIYGGYFCLRSERIWWTSGSLDTPPSRLRDIIKDSIEREFKQPLREVI